MAPFKDSAEFLQLLDQFSVIVNLQNPAERERTNLLRNYYASRPRLLNFSSQAEFRLALRKWKSAYPKRPTGRPRGRGLSRWRLRVVLIQYLAERAVERELLDVDGSAARLGVLAQQLISASKSS